MKQAVSLGIDRLLQDDGPAQSLNLLTGRRIGMLTHQAAVDGRMQPSFISLSRSRRLKLRRLFSPEHGLFGAVQDTIHVADAVEPHTGLPVTSLFGPRYRPDAAALHDIDVLLCDLQDVGVRFYTYVTTLVQTMEACARAGVEVVVLDRPNPLGGGSAFGPVLEPGLRSFLGYLPVPLAHGLTIGELARWANRVLGIGCRLHVVEMDGFTRQAWPKTGLSWALPSPNLPSWETARLYPGMCLLEGTTLSEGRGTTRPFEIVGAPWVDGVRLADALNRRRLPDVAFQPVQFVPQFWRYAGHACGGVHVHYAPEDPHTVDVASVLRIAIAVLQEARRLWPDEFRWRPAAEVAVHEPAGALLIDLLAGTDAVRRAVDTLDEDLSRLSESWRRQGEAFWESTKEDRLYG